jgi:hypothetical protein
LPEEHDLLVHEIEEISFVPRGANRKEYLLVKEDRMKSDVVLSILETPDEEVGKFLKEAQIEGEAGDVLAFVGKFLKSYKDKLPADALTIIGKACGYSAPAKPKEPAKQKKDDQGSADEGCGDNGDDEGYGYPGLQQKMEKMDPDLKGFFEKLLNDNKAARTEAKEAGNLAKSLKLENLTKAYTVRAESLPHIPGLSVEKMAKAFMAVGESHPDEFKDLYNCLKAADEFIEKSSAWDEIGRGQEGMGGSTYQKILTMAQGLVQKSDKPLLIEEAIEKVLDLHPEMYEEYEAERAAAAGGA